MRKKGMINAMDSVGIIVPVYNVKERYLRECIDSLVNQTYENIKIYMIDDKSKEWCGRLCDKIGRSDERITVIHHKVNKGLPEARNTGVKACDCQWVAYVDGDDWVDRGMCEKFFQYLKKLDDAPDIFMFRGYRSYPDHEEACVTDGKILSLNTKDDIFRFQKEALTTFLKGNMDNTIPVESACGKFFNRDFLMRNGIVFRDLQFREDAMYFQEAAEFATHIICAPDLAYHYRMRANSMVNVYRKNAPKELESYLEMLWAFAEKRGKGAEYERALYGAAFFAMQTVITNYFYHPKCPLRYRERKNECEKYFQKKYFSGVCDAFPLNEIKRNHRIKMMLLKKGKYFWVRALRDIYLSVHRQTCYD